MPNRIVVSFGSNINKEENLPAAVRLLNNLCKIKAVSAVYETMPVGKQEQDCFFNAAALVETELDAQAFRSEVLNQIEKKLGRVRTADKNAPRTIDADMTLFNQEVFNLDSTHHIPEPDLLRFPHVAVPVAEVGPDFIHPETGETLSKIASQLVEKNKDDILKKRTDIDLNAILVDATEDIQSET
jgi:2-amino-4-hydroxy-6-hydroxymethyldihydropteridine diphosphokinase